MYGWSLISEVALLESRVPVSLLLCDFFHHDSQEALIPHISCSVGSMMSISWHRMKLFGRYTQLQSTRCLSPRVHNLATMASQALPFSIQTPACSSTASSGRFTAFSPATQPAHNPASSCFAFQEVPSQKDCETLFVPPLISFIKISPPSQPPRGPLSTYPPIYGLPKLVTNARQKEVIALEKQYHILWCDYIYL